MSRVRPCAPLLSHPLSAHQPVAGGALGADEWPGGPRAQAPQHHVGWLLVVGVEVPGNDRVPVVEAKQLRHHIGLARERPQQRAGGSVEQGNLLVRSADQKLRLVMAEGKGEGSRTSPR